VASKKEKLQLRLRQLIETASPAVISEPIAGTVRDQLAPVSDKLFRDLLRECGVPLAPLVEGVRQEDLPSLERTLLALADEYRNPDLRRRCRMAVIHAKDHARLVARNAKVDPEKRAMKDEMVLWMLTWLENPAVFEVWVPMRKQHLKSGSD
jgi:hypothetical protein